MEVYQDEYSFNTIRSTSNYCDDDDDEDFYHDEYSYHTQSNLNKGDYFESIDADELYVHVKKEPDVITIDDSDEDDLNGSGGKTKYVKEKKKLNGKARDVLNGEGDGHSNQSTSNDSPYIHHPNTKSIVRVKMKTTPLRLNPFPPKANENSKTDDEDDDDGEMMGNDDEGDKKLLVAMKSCDEDDLFKEAPKNKYADYGFNFMEEDPDEDCRTIDGSKSHPYYDVDVEDDPNDSYLDEPQIKKPATNYECPLCNKEVVSKYNLKRHMMIHTGEKPFNCDVCNKGFRECSDLRKHKKVHMSGNKIFECHTCRRSYPTYKTTKCYFCEEDEPDPNDPSTNVPEDYNIKPYKCFLCEQLLFSSAELKVHIRQYHPQNVKPNMYTKHSNGLRHQPQNAINNININLKQIIRKDADNSNSSSDEYDGYVKLHKCLVCRKGFHNKDILKVHVLSHNI